MYIEKTTAEEREIIEEAVGGFFLHLDKALCLFDEIMSRHFLLAKPKALSASEVETVGVYLQVISDIVFDAVLGYALTIGDEDWRGVKPHLDGARKAMDAIQEKNEARHED